MKRIITLTLTAVLLIHSSILNAQHGVAPQWTSNIELPTPPASSDVGGFLYSNMTVLSNGKRIIFLNKKDGTGGIFHTYSYDGLSWSTPVMFAPDSLVIGLNSPKVISDQNDTLHIIWSSQVPKALYYTKMDSALNVMLDSVRISDNPDFNSYQGMYPTTDRSERIHVMWHEGKTGEDIPEAYYSRSTDGGTTWNAKDSLSTHDGLSSAFPRGQFNAHTGDTLAIFWRDTSAASANDWDIQMVVSQDGGANWSSSTVINSNTNYQGDPDIVIDPNGRFHLFYHEAASSNPYWGMRLLYGYSDDLGVTWNPSSAFNDTISLAQRSYLPEGSRYDLQNDVLWTFWKEEDMLGFQGGDMMASYSLNRGVSWSTPEYVTDRNDTTIGFKSVALLPNGGLAVNYELPNYPNSGEMRVFYKERTTLLLSINSMINDPSILIYPNPATGDVKIQFGEMKVQEIEVFNMKGQLIFHDQLSNNQAFYDLDFDTYLKGFYIVKLRSTEGMLTRKIIKQ